MKKSPYQFEQSASPPSPLSIKDGEGEEVLALSFWAGEGHTEILRCAQDDITSVGLATGLTA